MRICGCVFECLSANTGVCLHLWVDVVSNCVYRIYVVSCCGSNPSLGNCSGFEKEAGNKYGCVSLKYERIKVTFSMFLQ